MITGAQITAGRALLGWSRQDLARHAGLDIAEVQDVEISIRMPKQLRKHLGVIQQAMEDAGVEFINFVGVQLLPHEFVRQARATGPLCRITDHPAGMDLLPST